MQELRAAWGRSVANKRQERGWNQYELAHRVGVSQSAISFIEGGHWSPSDATRMALAEAFDTTVEELFPYPAKERS